MRGRRAENPTCRIDGCAKATRSHGMCAMHYQRTVRHGDPGEGKQQQAASWAGVACSIDGCDSQVRSLGYCLAHYKRLKRWGDPNIKRPTRPAEDRFWSRVDKSGDCWLWLAGQQGGGYGAFDRGAGDKILAHRYSYELAHGAIPEGHVIDHLCRVRACVNPDHLEAVTNLENLRRGLGYGLQNGMRTACVNGHEYTAENTYVDPKGGARCRTCQRNRELNTTRKAS